MPFEVTHGGCGGQGRVLLQRGRGEAINAGDANDSVYEHDDAGPNTSTADQPLDIALRPFADLVVDFVTAPVRLMMFAPHYLKAVPRTGP